MNDNEIEAKLGQLRTSVRPVLAYSQRKIKDHTIHGAEHSESIERHLNSIISRTNLHKGAKCNIEPIERYLLICSACYTILETYWVEQIITEKHAILSIRLLKNTFGVCTLIVFSQ